MIETLIKLFLPILLGYLLVKINYLPKDISKHLKLFVVRVTVPPLVFKAMYTTDLKTLKQIVPVASSYVTITVLLIVISFFLLFFIKDKKKKAAYMITIVWGNYGYMGWAVLKEALGDGGFRRGVFFTTLWWPVLYLGAFLVSKITGNSSKLNIKSYVLNMAVPFISLSLGIILNVLKVPIAEPILHTLTKLGDMTVTIILFSVGLTISFRNSLSNFKDSLIPVLLRPTLGFIAGAIAVRVIGVSDPLSIKAITIESVMPVAVFAVVIGDMLGLDEKLLSSILILSTILSLLIIPLSLYYLI